MHGTPLEICYLHGTSLEISYMHGTLFEICYLHGTPIEICILKPSFKRLMYGYTRSNVCRKLRLINHAISKKGYGCKLT
jgi:hypothetical protein